jgi:DNA-binding winged helix-turn-helix (wHTH) protein/Flp pilus assembly protein TadD
LQTPPFGRLSRVPEHPVRKPAKLRFGVFEVDLAQRELRKRGLRIRLQEKPFKILELLLAARGRLVTRREITETLWPSLNVSFDQSLNTAVNALRQALGDSSKSARYIETRPGLGYCFLAPIDELNGDSIARPLSSRDTAQQQEYRKGRHFYERMTEASLRQSAAYFESAISLDSQYWVAQAGLADVHATLSLLNACSPDEGHAASNALLSVALTQSPNSAEILVSAGLHYRTFHRDLIGSAAALADAVRADPGSAAAHRELALTSAAQSSFEAALQSAARAIALEPVSLANNYMLAWILYLSGRAREAQEQCWKTLALDPALPFAQYILGLAYEQLGFMEEAITELENSRLGWSDNPAALAGLAHAYSKAGMSAEALRTAEELERAAAIRYVSPYWLAIAHIALGDMMKSRRLLDQARDENDVWLVWAPSDPRLVHFQ